MKICRGNPCDCPFAPTAFLFLLKWESDLDSIPKLKLLYYGGFQFLNILKSIILSLLPFFVNGIQR